MGAQLRVYRRRIRSVQATKKITKAMELIAASRIVKAQNRLAATRPYTIELSRALTAAASNSTSIDDHPLLSTQKQKRAPRPCVVITADRGLAGAYSSNAIQGGAGAEHPPPGGARATRSFPTWSGARPWAVYRFRDRPLARAWTGSRTAQYEDATEIADAVLERFLQPHRRGRCRRDPHRLHPVPQHGQQAAACADPAVGSRRGVRPKRGFQRLGPCTNSSPSAEAVLDALFPVRR